VGVGVAWDTRVARPMTAEYVVQILHGVGFLTGAGLYGMLVTMVLRDVRHGAPGVRRDGGLAMLTGVLGLVWNFGALVLVTHPRPSPALSASAYAALGLLPAVFVHAAARPWRSARSGLRVGRWIVGLGYTLAGGAALAQVGEAAAAGRTPSRVAFEVLAVGFLGIVVLMVVASPADARRRGGFLWAGALALFSVSAWHLGQHEPGAEAWHAVVLGHHASIPLALAILWIDFRFALADIFLKRALAVLILVSLVVGLYLGLYGARLGREQQLALPPEWVLVALALFTATALSYPAIRKVTGWFVDVVLLKRPDASALRTEIARRLLSCDTAEDTLAVVTGCLAPALSAETASWEVCAEAAPMGQDLVRLPDRADRLGLGVFVPAAEPPHYLLRFHSLGGGRRILSDDVALLESVALITARRLDALRWIHERCERDLREQLVAKLATEAELRALQAQLNPHFLFNALNTLGYLMKAAPDRARTTLLDLTKLLRAVLKRSGGGVVTLGQEIDLVESYLAVERARFEDRLRLHVDVPLSLRTWPVPPLLVQPLVENAIKHGIAPRRAGGEIVVKAWAEGSGGGGGITDILFIEVSDTGVGASDLALAEGRARGVGLTNVERRLRVHYGTSAGLSVASHVGTGTRATLRLPSAPMRNAPAGSAAMVAERR
jgi:signal transduction histidine kinase